MKWFIVALMFNVESDQDGTDIFDFTKYPFPDEIICRAFLIKNRELSAAIASKKYDGRPVKNVVCVDEIKLQYWITGEQSI